MNSHIQGLVLVVLFLFIGGLVVAFVPDPFRRK